MPSTRRALGDIGNLVGSSGFISERAVSVANPKQQQQAAIDRPITRRYAQQLDAQAQAQAQAQVQAQLQCHQVLPKPPAASRVKAPLPKSSRPAPLKKKEPTLTAQLTALSDSEMKDVGERELVEPPVPNIDEQDVGNQLAVVDYVEDIYSFYRKAESQSCVSPNYMASQVEINEKMRAILVDWLIDVHLKFKLMPETLFLTINLLDRYLAVQSVSRKYLQLVGMTAMLIGSKYEEIWAPEVKHFEYISDHAYTKDQILSMEKKMLNTLRFNLTVPTPYVFVKRCLKASSSSDRTDRQMDLMSFFYVELCLTELKMLKYCPSLLSASAVYASRCCLKKSPLWTYALQRHSGYTEDQLRECAGHMAKLHKQAVEAPDDETPTVFKKYSTVKFGEVAKLISPAKQLLVAQQQQ